MKNILGISGLDASVRFKEQRFPGIDPRMYRMAQGFDSAAVLIKDSCLVQAVAEERFTLEKGTGKFPVHAIRSCLDAAGLKPTQLTSVAHGFDYEPHRARFESDELATARYAEVYSREAQLELLEREFGGSWDSRFQQVPHHVAHAASAFYPSGFDNSLVVVADGLGEAESVTVFSGSADGLSIIGTVPGIHSIGILYSLFTYHLGFTPNIDEYKVMGLAPYGDRKKLYQKIMRLVTLRPDGKFVIPSLYRNPTVADRETYRGTLEIIEDLVGPCRVPETELTERHCHIAAGLQAALETTLLHFLSHYATETGLTDLCMAGGVALNCTANARILSSGLFKRVYVQPAAGDDGTALGAALYVHQLEKPHTSVVGVDSPLCGPAFSDTDVESALSSRSDLRWKRVESFTDVAAEIAHQLALGRIIGVFQDRMEYGPRALGNRSILGDPRKKDMRDLINSKVKKREGFRPFAPAIKEEGLTTYFDVAGHPPDTYSNMLFTAPVKARYRDELPAVTHVDGSARVQTVSRTRNPKLWSILDAFECQTGMPVVLNTSFNVRGQPIVCSPVHAIETAISAELDVLAIGNFLVHLS